jgi:cell division cycle protein 37
MSGFDYSKWDRLEVSDDEDTFHPNLDKGLNVRVNRITRDRKEEEIDNEKKVLMDKGEVEKAAKLESKRPLHVNNVCQVTDERTIIHSVDGSRKDTRKKGQESFSVDEYTMFKQDNEDLLKRFEKADWETSRKLLMDHGDILMEEYANSYFMLTCLDEEMKGNRSRVRQLCSQGQIISQIHQLAEPMKRPPRDLVPRFFEKFERDESKAAFQEGVDHFMKNIIQRAVDKKKEEADAEAEAAAQPQEDMQPVPLVEAMYQMSVEDRKGPGGLDPVEVFESLPEVLQNCFKSGDVEMLKKVAQEMPPAEFDHHFKQCVDAGLWSGA